MTRWEYMFVEVNVLRSGAWLDLHGDDGWELVAVVRADTVVRADPVDRCYFKRRKARRHPTPPRAQGKRPK